MIICFGEIMLRLSPPNNLRVAQARSLDVQYGGSEANVAVALAQFGAPSAYITRVPDSEVGRASLGELKKYGVDTNLTVFGGNRLGLYFLEVGAGNRASKVVYDREGSGMATLQKGMIDWHTIFKGATWFHWSGITPAISQSAADATLEAIEIANELGITVSCDLNYRSNLWQYGKKPSEIMPKLLEGCAVMLGDGDTIDTYFELKGRDYKEVFEKTFTQFPKLQYIAMTARRAFHASHNAYKGFLHDGDTLYESREFDVPDIIDRIGAGDAFMGGLIYCLQKKETPLHKESYGQYCVDFSAATGALKHSIHSDFNLASVAEVENLMHGNTGGKVSR
jgi:2-dehydro-3-deoxygluconokinase